MVNYHGRVFNFIFSDKNEVISILFDSFTLTNEESEKAEQYAGVIKLLKREYPVRNIAKIENVGISTVMRLKKEICE